MAAEGSEGASNQTGWNRRELRRSGVLPQGAHESQRPAERRSRRRQEADRCSDSHHRGRRGAGAGTGSLRGGRVDLTAKNAETAKSPPFLLLRLLILLAEKPLKGIEPRITRRAADDSGRSEQEGAEAIRFAVAAGFGHGDEAGALRPSLAFWWRTSGCRKAAVR